MFTIKYTVVAVCCVLLLADIKAASAIKVAFSAGLKAHFLQSSATETLKFTDVKVNLGNAYNHTSGQFTAPLKGVYKFDVFGLELDTDPAALDLRRNGVIEARAWSRADPSSTAALSLMLQLERGDKVYVTVPPGGAIYGPKHCMFTGFLYAPMLFI